MAGMSDGKPNSVAERLSKNGHKLVVPTPRVDLGNSGLTVREPGAGLLLGMVAQLPCREVEGRGTTG